MLFSIHDNNDLKWALITQYYKRENILKTNLLTNIRQLNTLKQADSNVQVFEITSYETSDSTNTVF